MRQAPFATAGAIGTVSYFVGSMLGGTIAGIGLPCFLTVLYLAKRFGLF